MKRLLGRKSGVTFVEVMVSSGITVIVLLAMVSLYISYQRQFCIGSVYLDVYSNARLAMDWMVRDTRSATQLSPSHGSYTTSNDTIVLQIPAIDASEDIVVSTYDYIIYRVNDAKVERIVDADALSSREDQTRTIASNCESLAFGSGGTGLSDVADVTALTEISISVTMSKTTGSLSGATNEVIEATLESTVKLRNKS